MSGLETNSLVDPARQESAAAADAGSASRDGSDPVQSIDPVQGAPAGPDGELAARLNRARASVLDLALIADESVQFDVTATAAVLLDLLEIAQCWISDADPSRQPELQAMIEFAEAACLKVHASLSAEQPDLAPIVQLRSEAEQRWGEYLDLFEPRDSLDPDALPNPWRDLLRLAETQAASTVAELDSSLSAPDLVKILAALAGSGLSIDRSSKTPSQPESPGDAIFEDPPVGSSTRGSGKIAATLPVPPEPNRLELDAELRSAYLEDAERCVASIEETLLGLESDPSDTQAINQLCRALHTLKGASASVGLGEFASYLHELEDFVHASCSEALDIQRMLQGVDVMRAQMKAVQASGNPSDTAQTTAAKSTEAPPAAARTDLAPAAPPLGLVGNSVTTRPSEESIRVESARLDRLMDLLGELVISRNRRDTQVSRLKQLHAELIRAVARLRVLGEAYNAVTPLDSGGKHGRERPGTEHADSGACDHPSYLSGEIVNDLTEIARSLRELYEPVADENRVASRLMGEFRHELMELRRLPLSGLILRLQRAARDAAHIEGKQVQFHHRGEHAGLEPSLQERLYEPLLHLVRNAVSHGIESDATRRAAGKQANGTVTVETRGDPTTLVIEVRDDGRGLDYDAIRNRGLELGLLDRSRPASRAQIAQLIFHPGFSTRQQVSEVSGRGVGMDVVASVLDRLRGQIEVESTAGQGTTVRLRIPLRSSIEHAMVFRVDGRLFALPMQFVQAAKPIGLGRSNGSDSNSAIAGLSNGSELPWVRIRDLMSLNGTPRPAEEHSLIVSGESSAPPHPPETGSSGLRSGTEQRVALLVDAVVGPEEVVVRSLPAFFKRHRLLAGVTLSGAGEIVMLLDGRELIERAAERLSAAPDESAAVGRPAADGRTVAGPQRVLVVDDSVSVRRGLRRMLERRGYSVSEAADGLEAIELLRTQSFSLVLTDLEMPRLGGMELLAEIRRSRRTRPIQVAVVTSVTSPEMESRARELGAYDYVVKPVNDASVAQLLASVPPENASE